MQCLTHSKYLIQFHIYGRTVLLPWRNAIMFSYRKEKESEVTQSCLTLWDPLDCRLPGSSLHPWDFPGKSTGVGCHFLLQGIFSTQGLNPGLPYFMQSWATRETSNQMHILIAPCNFPQCYSVSKARHIRHISTWMDYHPERPLNAISRCQCTS